MGHVMDLGVDEAYRHEATVEREQTPELDRIGFERLIVTCTCGRVWSGEHEIGYFDAVEDGGDIEADEQVLGDWERHVWEQIKAAGQFTEAAARSVKASAVSVPEWDTLTIKQQRAQVAEHYADVVARSLATLRKSLKSETASSESRTAMLRWFAQNIQDQGRMMAQRLDELGGWEL